jgi:hypothetical protein
MKRTAQDKARAASQCARIIRDLRRRPCTSEQLAFGSRSLNYTARISELRQLGYRIDCERSAGGLYWYTLLREPRRVPRQLRLV